jgi:hypothetical protein
VKNKKKASFLFPGTERWFSGRHRNMNIILKLFFPEKVFNCKILFSCRYIKRNTSNNLKVRTTKLYFFIGKKKIFKDIRRRVI